MNLLRVKNIILSLVSLGVFFSLAVIVLLVGAVAVGLLSKLRIVLIPCVVMGVVLIFASTIWKARRRDTKSRDLSVYLRRYKKWFISTLIFAVVATMLISLMFIPSFYLGNSDSHVWIREWDYVLDKRTVSNYLMLFMGIFSSFFWFLMFDMPFKMSGNKPLIYIFISVLNLGICTAIDIKFSTACVNILIGGIFLNIAFYLKKYYHGKISQKI